MPVTLTSLADYLAMITSEYTLDDAATPYSVYPVADRTLAINEGRERIAMKLMLGATRCTVTTTTGVQKYDLTSRSSKMMMVDNVFYNTKPLERVYDRKDYQFGRTLTDNAEPNYFYVDEGNQNLFLFPPPDAAKTCYVYHYQLPSKMNSTITTEAVIPPVYRRLVVDFALYKGFKREGITHDATKIAFYQKAFNDGIQEAKDFMRQSQLRGARKKISFRGYKLRDTSYE